MDGFNLVQRNSGNLPDAVVQIPIAIDRAHENINTIASSSRTLNDGWPSNESSKITASLLRAQGALDKFVSAVKAISQVHPIAQASVALVTLAYDAWKDHGVRDVRVVSLARTMAELWEFMTQDECLARIASVKSTVNAMLEQTSQCAEFIRRYTSNSKQVVRFAKNIASDTDTIITTFEQSLAKLRADFLAGIDVATVIAVLDIRSTVLDTTKLVTQTHHVVAENQRVGLETKDVVLDIQQTLGKIEVDLSRMTRDINKRMDDASVSLPKSRKAVASGGNGRDIIVPTRSPGRADIIGFGISGVTVAQNSTPRTTSVEFTHPYLAYSNFGSHKDAGGWQLDKHLRVLADTTASGLGDLVGFGNSGVWIAVSNGYGMFQPIRMVLEDFGCDQGWRIDQHPRFMVNLTGDGRADILGFGQAGVTISRNNGDGTFGRTQLVSDQFSHHEGWVADRHPRFLYDSNGDGLPDIYGFGDTGVYVAVNNIHVNNTFKGANLVVNDFGYSSGWLVDRHPRFVVDLNGIGTGDIIGFGYRGVIVSLNDGTGKFSPAHQVLDEFGYNHDWRVEKHPRLVTDMTGDGKADIVGFGNAGVMLAINNGDGTFQDARLVVSDFGHDQGWRVERHHRFIADLTGDGRADIVGIGEHGVYVAINRGDGRFGPVRKVSEGFGFAAGWDPSTSPCYLCNLSFKV